MLTYEKQRKFSVGSFLLNVFLNAIQIMFCACFFAEKFQKIFFAFVRLKTKRAQKPYVIRIFSSFSVSGKTALFGIKTCAFVPIVSTNIPRQKLRDFFVFPAQPIDKKPRRMYNKMYY